MNCPVTMGDSRGGMASVNYMILGVLYFLVLDDFVAVQQNHMPMMLLDEGVVEAVHEQRWIVVLHAEPNQEEITRVQVTHIYFGVELLGVYAKINIRKEGQLGQCLPRDVLEIVSLTDCFIEIPCREGHRKLHGWFRIDGICLHYARLSLETIQGVGGELLQIEW